MPGDLISGAGSVIGGMFASDSASDAADAQSRAILESQQVSIEEANKAKAEALALYDPALADFAAALNAGIDELRSGSTEVFDILQRSTQDSNRILADTGSNVSNAILGLPVSPLEYYSNNFMQGEQAPYNDRAYMQLDNDRSPGTWTDDQIANADTGEGALNPNYFADQSADRWDNYVPMNDPSTTIMDFYRTTLGREPLSEGFNYWLNSGLRGAELITAMETAAIENGELTNPTDTHGIATYDRLNPDDYTGWDAREQSPTGAPTNTNTNPINPTDGWVNSDPDGGITAGPTSGDAAIVRNWFNGTLRRQVSPEELMKWTSTGLSRDELIAAMTDGAISSGELPESARAPIAPTAPTGEVDTQLAEVPTGIFEEGGMEAPSDSVAQADTGTGGGGLNYTPPPDDYLLPVGVTREEFTNQFNRLMSEPPRDKYGRPRDSEYLWHAAATEAQQVARREWFRANNTSGRDYYDSGNAGRNDMFNNWQQQTYGGGGANAAQPNQTQEQTPLSLSSIVQHLF